jgi:hypothetical protein
MGMWKQLYALVWLSFLQIVIVVAPSPSSYTVDAHALVGLIILGVAHYNNVSIKKTEAPGRLKRTAKATAVLASVQAILGVTLYAGFMFMLDIPSTIVFAITLVHLVIALAIITQASSVATAYDMWEEHEFTPPPMKPS